MSTPGAPPVAPTSRAARHARIAEVLERRPVRSQGELAQALAGQGIDVTQATLSRDLLELGATKVHTPQGRLYALPAEGGDRSRLAGGAGLADARLARLAEELVVTAEASANLVVLRTPPGAAQFLASAVDRAVLPEVLGCVAGDDTVVLVTRDPAGGREVAAAVLALASGSSASGSSASGSSATAPAPPHPHPHPGPPLEGAHP